MTLSGCDKAAVVTLMTVATLCYGAMFSGVVSNHIDIASNYAGEGAGDADSELFM